MHQTDLSCSATCGGARLACLIIDSTGNGICSSLQGISNLPEHGSWWH